MEEIMKHEDRTGSWSRGGLMAAAIGLGALLSIGAQSADARTLDEIKAAGKIEIGVLAANPPWGYIDASGKHVGYDVDVVSLFSKELGVPADIVQVTGGNRTAQLLAGKVDILIAAVGMYPDRAKAVQFSKPYLQINIGLIAKKDVNIATPADMKKYRIGAARSSAQANGIIAAAPDVPIQYFDDDASSIQALLSGQVDAVGGNTTYPGILKGLDPNGAYEMKLVFNTQPTGMAVAPGNKSLLDFANAFIDKVVANGELGKIYEKYLGEPLPTFPTSVEGVPFYIN
jgi:polar amino acid transport system substrate-binding protein